MAYAVRISTLYIGQGLCNVVEVHKSATPFSLPKIEGNVPTFAAGAALAFLAIVDMGTITLGTQPTGGKWQLQQAAAFLRPLLIARGMTLDALYISHLDQDHYNGFKLLCGGARIKVNKVVIGGEKRPSPVPDPPDPPDVMKHEMNESKMLNDLKKCGFEFKALDETSSYYAFPDLDPHARDPSPLHCNVELEGGDALRMNVLLRRAPLAPGATDPRYRYEKDNIWVNAGSALLFVSVCRPPAGPGKQTLAFSALLPGDATWETLRDLYLKGFHYGMEPKYFVIPHHGSLKTAVLDETNPDLSVWTMLMFAFTPGFAAVSAHDQFEHPDHHIMDLVGPFTQPDSVHANRVFRSAYCNEDCARKLFTTFFEDQAPTSSSFSPSSSAAAFQGYCRNIHITYHSAYEEGKRLQLATSTYHFDPA